MVKLSADESEKIQSQDITSIHHESHSRRVALRRCRISIHFHSARAVGGSGRADIFRVNITFYSSASTMYYSLSAPILSSYDLINREFVGHSVPLLDWGDIYDLNAG